MGKNFPHLFQKKVPHPSQDHNLHTKFFVYMNVCVCVCMCVCMWVCLSVFLCSTQKKSIFFVVAKPLYNFNCLSFRMKRDLLCYYFIHTSEMFCIIYSIIIFASVVTDNKIAMDEM